MRVASANEASSFCMASSGSVEQRKDVGKGERNQHQRRHDPEDGLVGSSNLGNRADLAWLARLHRTEDALPGKVQRYQRRADEDRAKGSSTVRLPIQAPLKPSATSTSGPRQQVEARMAAS